MTATIRMTATSARATRRLPVGVALLALALATLTLTACGTRTPPPPAPSVRVENSELSLVIAALPAAFEVSDNAGETLALAAPEAGGGVEITVGPLQLGGINLVEVVKQRRAEIEAEGLYFGNRELMTPNGPAYTTRGQLTGPDGPVEQTAVYSLHPDGSDRLMTVTYSYPGGGDSQARVGELLELLGEIEAL